MAIAVRSVKAGMTRFGYLRSRLKDGAKLGCWGAAIGPQLGRWHNGYVEFGVLSVRNLTQPYKRPAYETLLSRDSGYLPHQSLTVCTM